MPLTNDELQRLQDGAYACDGEPFEVFERGVPHLATLSEGELWALAGMFLDRWMTETAKFLAAYARTVMEHEVDKQQRPDPVRFLAEYRAKEDAYEAMPPPPF